MVYDGALKTAIEQTDMWKPFQAHVTSPVSLLGNKGMRAKRLASLVGRASLAEFKLLRTFGVAPVDWDWGTLETTLDMLMLEERFSVL